MQNKHDQNKAVWRCCKVSDADLVFRFWINGFHFAICKAGSKMSSPVKQFSLSKEKAMKLQNCQIFACGTKTLDAVEKLLWSEYHTKIQKL